MTKRDPIQRIMESTFEIGRIMRHKMCDVRVGGGELPNFLQIHALVSISEHKGMTMKELAESLHVTSPTATTFVNRLVKLRWVNRAHDTKNRKLVRLRVTPIGMKMLQSMKSMRQKMIKELFSYLTPEECETLASLHEKIIARYQPSHS